MDKETYKLAVQYEKSEYIKLSGGNIQFFIKKLKSHPDYMAWKYTRMLRKTGYYYSYRKKNLLYSCAYIWACRKKNTLGRKLGIEMGENCAEKGLMIFHTQGWLSMAMLVWEKIASCTEITVLAMMALERAHQLLETM